MYWINQSTNITNQTMKKLSGILMLFVLFFATNCTQKQQQAASVSTVSAAEYKLLDENTQVLADLMNAAITGLAGAELNNANYKNKKAIVLFGNDKAQKGFNMVTIAPQDDSKKPETGVRSSICVAGDAYKCITAVKKYMTDKKLNSITATITKTETCTEVSYE